MHVRPYEQLWVLDLELLGLLEGAEELQSQTVEMLVSHHTQILL